MCSYVEASTLYHFVTGLRAGEAYITKILIWYSANIYRNIQLKQ